MDRFAKLVQPKRCMVQLQLSLSLGSLCFGLFGVALHNDSVLALLWALAFIGIGSVGGVFFVKHESWLADFGSRSSQDEVDTEVRKSLRLACVAILFSVVATAVGGMLEFGFFKAAFLAVAMWGIGNLVIGMCSIKALRLLRSGGEGLDVYTRRVTDEQTNNS